MRRRARDAPTTEVANDVEQSFQDETLAPAPQRRGRGSSGSGVMYQGVFVLGAISTWIFFLARYFVTLIARNV